MILDYPESRPERIHGPVGYASYESFRPWLRDEFTFRCVYKLDQTVDDPLTILSSETAIVLPDGVIAAEQVKTKRLIQQLDLNSPSLRKWRVMWMRIADLAKERDADLYQQLVGFPEDLPNLDRLRPPSNSRLSGIEASWYAKRQRGQLPETY